MRKVIGIFGGSFDPIHKGHIEIAKAALKEGGVDEVWLMVSPENPLKQGTRKAPVADRLKMAEIAVGELPKEYAGRIKVSDFETHLPIPSYTYATLKALSDAYPDHSFKWIIGGDNLAAINKWYNPKAIIEEYGLIVYPRPEEDGGQVDQLQTPAKEKWIEGCLDGISKSESLLVILKDVKLMAVSSTELRKAIREGDTEVMETGLPRGVMDYLAAHPIYGQ